MGECTLDKFRKTPSDFHSEGCKKSLENEMFNKYLPTMILIYFWRNQLIYIFLAKKISWIERLISWAVLEKIHQNVFWRLLFCDNFNKVGLDQMENQRKAPKHLKIWVQKLKGTYWFCALWNLNFVNNIKGPHTHEPISNRDLNF